MFAGSTWIVSCISCVCGCCYRLCLIPGWISSCPRGWVPRVRVWLVLRHAGVEGVRDEGDPHPWERICPCGGTARSQSFKNRSFSKLSEAFDMKSFQLLFWLENWVSDERSPVCSQEGTWWWNPNHLPSTSELCGERPAVGRRSGHGGAGQPGGRTVRVAHGTRYQSFKQFSTLDGCCWWRVEGMLVWRGHPAHRRRNNGRSAWQELAWVCPGPFAVLVAGASGQAGVVQQLLSQLKASCELRRVDGSGCGLAAPCCLRSGLVRLCAA